MERAEYRIVDLDTALALLLKEARIHGVRAIEKWGPEKQAQVAISELGELITEIARRGYGRGTDDPTPIVGEIADVLIVCMQLAEIYGQKPEGPGLLQMLSIKLEKLKGHLRT